MYCDHRFDLLGSGWVRNDYGSKSLGLEGYRYEINLPIKLFDKDANWLKLVVRAAHLKKSREIWALIEGKYDAIDWQKDYKSGYRWNAKKWYKEQKYGIEPGVDIKVPWELARMQHLPQMALFAVIFPDTKELLTREFRNQVLDFIATNPPQMGVNWTCTMDVAIRAANMLLAFDIFRQVDTNKLLNDSFERVFEDSMYLHGKHIVDNLEYSKELTSNHYLSNISGLTFIASYLGCSPEIDSWLAFSVQELISEMRKQFYEDGGNFEASTCYHRLSGEMMAYATAIVIGLDETKRSSICRYPATIWRTKQPKLKPFEEQVYNVNEADVFPDWYMERLLKSGLFTYHIMKPTGEIPQIGDNDSGRFFRLSPNGHFLSSGEATRRYANLTNYPEFLDSLTPKQPDENIFWDENILEHSTLVSAIGGLFENREFTESKNKFPCEASMIRTLAARSLPMKHNNVAAHGMDRNSIAAKTYPFHYQKVFAVDTSCEKSLRTNLSLIQFPNIGIYVFKSDRLYLSIFAGPNGQNDNGGHAHNDKLSFELTLDGNDIEIDPGTYLYTPSTQMRNNFRSAAVHNGPHVRAQEPNNWDRGIAGLFKLEDNALCTILELQQYAFCGRVEYNDASHIRRIEIRDSCIIVDDYSTVDIETTLGNHQGPCSNGYGKLMNRNERIFNPAGKSNESSKAEKSV
jgi:hypothetical protein